MLSVLIARALFSSYLNAHNGGSDPNDAVGNQGADLLIVNITDTRNMLKELGLSLPVGNSDAGSYFNTKVLEAVDYGVRSRLVGIVLRLLMFVQ